MELIPFPIAVAFLLWLGWPKIKGWFEYKASVARHREFMRTYIPMPRSTAPIEEWKEYLSKATTTDKTVLTSMVYGCCDGNHKPRPEYLELVQLITVRLRELGFELIKEPKGRFVLQEFKAK